MAKGGLLRIKVLGDASGVQKAMKDTEGALGGLTGSLGKLGGALAVGAAIKEVGEFLGEAAKDAMADAQAKDVLHVAIKNVTGATEDELAALDKYIEKTQAATGFTEDDLRGAMTKLVGATGDITKAQDLLNIAMDTSTARGISLESVTMALEKAQNGNLAGLQRLGIATKDASGQALTYDQVLKQLGQTYGGATAAAADTMAGKMERMKLVFGEIKENLGASLMPIIQEFANLIMDNMPAISSIFESLGKAIGAITPIISALLPVAGLLIDWAATLIGWLADVITYILGPFTQGWEHLKGWLSGIWDAVSGAFVTAWETIKSGLETAWNAIKLVAETVWNAIKDFFLAWWYLIKGIFTGNFDDLKGIVGDKMGFISDALRTAWDAVKKFLGEIWDGIVDAFQGMWDSIKGAWDTAKGWIQGIPGAIKAFFSGAINWLKDIGSDIIQGLWDGMTAVWDKVIDWLKGVGDKISGAFKWVLDIFSPSKVMYKIGENIMEGLRLGMEATAPDALAVAAQTAAQIAYQMDAAASGSTFTSTNALGQTVNGWYGSNGWATSVMHNPGDYTEAEVKAASAIYAQQLAYWNDWKDNPMFSDTPIGTGGQASGVLASGTTGQMNAFMGKGGPDRGKQITINVTGNTGVEIGRAIVSALATV